MDWALELMLGSVVILVAAFLAAVVGFAYALIALPLLLLVGFPVEQVVAINLAIGLISRILILHLRWPDISWPPARRLALASIPGAALGLVVGGAIPSDQLQVGAGVTVLLGVATVLAVERHQLTRSPAEHRPQRGERGRVADLLAGGAGGFLGSTTSLNGMLPALLMTSRRAPARQVVADLAVYFVLGNACSLAMLTASQRVPWGEVAAPVLVWTPVSLLATQLGTSVGPRLPTPLFRRLTLVVIIASALVGITDSLLS